MRLSSCVCFNNICLPQNWSTKNNNAFFSVWWITRQKIGYLLLACFRLISFNNDVINAKWKSQEEEEDKKHARSKHQIDRTQSTDVDQLLGSGWDKIKKKKTIMNGVLCNRSTSTLEGKKRGKCSHIIALDWNWLRHLLMLLYLSK